MKTLALTNLILTVGDTVIHKKLGYTAKIEKFYSRGNALIEIPNTLENSRIWNGVKLPFKFKALNIAKYFKKQLLTLF